MPRKYKDKVLQHGQRYFTNPEIRDLMREKGLTMPVVAEELGIHRDTLVKWMKKDLPENIYVIILETVKRMPAR